MVIGITLGLAGSSFATVSAAATVRTPLTVGSAADLSTAASQFGGTSWLVDNANSADKLTIDASEYASIKTGTGAFTVEGWFKPDEAGASGQGESRFFYFGGAVNGSNSFGLSLTTAGGIFRGPGTTDLGFTQSNTNFMHYAFVYDGTNKSVYANGARLSTATATLDVSDSTDPYIGSGLSDARFNYSGNIDEFRISSVARYSGTSYTVPTGAFINDSDTITLLHADGTASSTQFLDDNGTGRNAVGIQSINGAAVDTANQQYGTASAEFDDSNDYLNIPDYTVGNFTGDFTIECWMDTADTLGEFMACQKQGTAEGWTFITRSLGRLVWTSTTDGSTASALLTSNNAWSDNTWVHIAVCHTNSSGLTEIFANGSRVASRTEQNPKTVTSGGYFRIGGNIYGVSSGTYSDGPRYFGGHLDEIRISDTVRYSGSSYTVPTAAFVNDTNTKLLIHANGTDGSLDFVDDNGQFGA